MSERVINHPCHYISGGMETIDVIEAFGLDFHRGNAMKYITRAGKKDPDKEAEDVAKAVWYLLRWLLNGKHTDVLLNIVEYWTQEIKDSMVTEQ